MYTWFWHCFRSIQSLLSALFSITDASRFRWLVDIYIYFYMLRYINGMIFVLHVRRNLLLIAATLHSLAQSLTHSHAYQCTESSLNFMVSIFCFGLACGMCLRQNIPSFSQLLYAILLLHLVWFRFLHLIQFDVINSIFISPSSLNLLIESTFFGYFFPS